VARDPYGEAQSVTVSRAPVRPSGSGAAMDLTASVPSFGAGTSLWALALVLISIPRVFPLPVRLLGLVAAVLFAATAVLIFAGVPVMPTTSPLPFYAYPVLVATLGGWIWSLTTGRSRPA
jgi:hypothetical protein